MIADGALLDCLRRLAVFGLFLVRLDIRQDAARHAAALAEITDYLGLGDYQQWDEQKRLTGYSTSWPIGARCCRRITTHPPIPPKCSPPVQ